MTTNTKHSRVWVAAIITLFVSIFCVCPAMADSVTDTISVYVGYFGFSEDEYIEKATYHWSDLDDYYGGALPTQAVVYSYYSGSRTYLAAARGFYIRDLLEYAGVDFGSIASIDFFTKDQTVGPYRSFSKYALFDIPRYYFPNLAVNEETGEIYAYDGGDIWSGAVAVEAMLALEDYTEWDAVGSEFQNLYDSTMFSASSRFHLFFGQADPSEANTSSAAKYVYKIFITFSGTPVLTTDETNIELKVGSDYHVTVNVSAEDPLLDAEVENNLVWTTSDESVVSVDSSGKLTVNGEGVAVITATYGNSSVSVTVAVSPDESGGAGGTGDAGAEGDTGTGGGIEGEAPASPVPENPPEASAETASSPDYEILQDSGVYILSSELMSQEDYALWAQSILDPKTETDSDAANADNSRNEGMDDDAEQLKLIMTKSSVYAGAICAVICGVFTAGFAYGLLRYKKHMKA